MASFMPPAYIRSLGGSQGAEPKTVVGKIGIDEAWTDKVWTDQAWTAERQMGKTGPQNANDHEYQARVHPAQPSYSVVVPAPEL